jgi:hypothetical protein
MPPFFAWPLIQKPSLSARLSSRSSHSSAAPEVNRGHSQAAVRPLPLPLPLDFYLAFVSSIRARRARVSPLKGGLAPFLESQFRTFSAPSLSGQSPARWPFSLHSKHRPSLISLALSSSVNRESLVTAVCVASRSASPPPSGPARW